MDHSDEASTTAGVNERLRIMSEAIGRTRTCKNGGTVSVIGGYGGW